MLDPKPLQLSGCAIVKDEKLLLLYRKEQCHYEFPGGKVKSDESIEDAARREVMEELGVNVNIVRYLGTIQFINPKTAALQESHKYLATIQEGEVPRVVETEKFSSLEWIDIAGYTEYSLAPNAREFCEKWLRGDYHDGTREGDLTSKL